MEIIKIIWEVLRSSPQIISIINELVKLIRGIAGSKKDTKEEIAKVTDKLKDMQNDLSGSRI